ncbi:MAG: hypothetical protein K0S70_113 [Microbacterium sp.]|jgi:hypothetical protein|nr:hypothetical protein [Microbacterium sp.]
MSKKRTWFGTRGFETWIPTPGINPDYTRAGWSSGEQQYTGGGAGYRESKNAHNVYVLDWGISNDREAIRRITDFADGVYDLLDGVNLVYWIDPMARDANVLNQAMATPSLGCEDAPPLITDADGSGRPKAVTTPANAFRYPARSAQFTQKPSSLSYSQYIPIPPGHSAWVGVHADTSGIMQVQRVNGYTTVGTPVPITTLGLEANLVNTEFTSDQSSGIVLGFTQALSTRTFTLYGLVVQILPTGVAPVAQNFISGQGHSGCQFVGKPAKTPYSAVFDRVSLTARLVETGMDL